MKNRQHTHYTFRLFFILSTLMFCGLFSGHPESVQANSISGRYLNTSGGKVVLQVSIGSPAPQNLILEQYLPPGTQVISSSPRARKINEQSGVVKWLFKRVAPGSIQVYMQVTPSSSSSSVSGNLRYRLPDGRMAETRISH